MHHKITSLLIHSLFLHWLWKYCWVPWEPNHRSVPLSSFVLQSSPLLPSGWNRARVVCNLLMYHYNFAKSYPPSFKTARHNYRKKKNWSKESYLRGDWFGHILFSIDLDMVRRDTVASAHPFFRAISKKAREIRPGMMMSHNYAFNIIQSLLTCILLYVECLTHQRERRNVRSRDVWLKDYLIYPFHFQLKKS